MPGYEAHTPEPRVDRVAIVHGWRDDNVPPANSLRFAALHRCTLYLLDGDHRLADKLFEIARMFDWFLDDTPGGGRARAAAQG
jgi:hypothetical protein